MLAGDDLKSRRHLLPPDEAAALVGDRERGVLQRKREAAQHVVFQVAEAVVVGSPANPPRKTRQQEQGTCQMPSHAWSPCHFQARQRPRAGSEPIGFQAQPLKDGDEHIGQRRVSGLAERQVLAVLEAAAGHDDRQVFVAVAAGVAEVRAEQDRRPVEERAAAVVGRVQLRQEIAKRFHLLDLDQRELGDLAGVLAVMRQVVIALGDALDRRARRGQRLIQT